MSIVSVRLSIYEEKLLDKISEEEGGKGRSDIMREGLNYKFQQRGLINSITEIENSLRMLIGTVLAATDRARERSDINDAIHENITYARIALEHLATEIAKEAVPAIDARFTEFKGLKAKKRRGPRISDETEA